jgi:hypothetical protein
MKKSKDTDERKMPIPSKLSGVLAGGDWKKARRYIRQHWTDIKLRNNCEGCIFLTNEKCSQGNNRNKYCIIAGIGSFVQVQGKTEKEVWLNALKKANRQDRRTPSS